MGDVKKLEEAKCLYKDANSDQRYVLERLFPELKECEDEWIEDYWKHHKVINHYSYDKGEEIQFDHQGFVRFCKKYCRKHAEWHAEDEQNLNACLGYLPDEFLARWLKDVIHREYDEPVWSEDDEKIFNRICDIIHCAAYGNCEVDENGEEKGEYARMIKWFKSIKDSVRPQNLADGLESLYCPLAQLKSGGSQVMKRWKPSKEQMKALSKALSLARVNGEEYKFDLRTLQGDLKKLIGE